jgi:lysozyme
MATKITSSKSSKKQLPPWGWGIIGAIVVAIGVGVWYINRVNVNEWRHVFETGIRMPMRYDIHGIDVSKHNAKIQWQQVRQMRFDDLRLQFVFIKATEGTSLIDKDFKANWQQSDAVGLYRGAYHFFIPWRAPEPQFDNFTKIVKLQKGDLPPVLDFEVGTNSLTREQVIENVHTWLKMAERHYGVKPIIYTNPDFYRRYIKDNLEDYPLWMADYSGIALNRYDADAKILFWQHSKSGKTEGIRGEVDYNVFLGDADDLKELCVK